MKVFDILTESNNKVDEGPLRYIAKKLGSKSAATSADIDSEVSSMYKDYKAFYKNTPDGIATAQNLGQFLKGKGLPGNVNSLIKGVAPSMMQKTAGAAKAGAKGAVKGAKAVGRGAKKAGAGAVNMARKGIDKVKNMGAKPVIGQQGEFQFSSVDDLRDPIYEGLFFEKDGALSKRVIMNVLKKATQGGFQDKVAGGDSPFGTSKYGKAQMNPKAKSVIGKAKAKASPNPVDHSDMIKTLKSAGYTVTKN